MTFVNPTTELSQLEYEPVMDLHEKLSKATNLWRCLTMPEARSRFTHCMRGLAPETFPSTIARHQDAHRGGSIERLGVPALARLEQALGADAAPLVAKAIAEGHDAQKTLYGEALPDDLEACMARLDELKATKKAQIAALQTQIEEMEGAEGLVCILQQNLRMARQLEERLLTTAASSPAKRAKNA
jgi:hypothetical protein